MAPRSYSGYKFVKASAGKRENTGKGKRRCAKAEAILCHVIHGFMFAEIIRVLLRGLLPSAGKKGSVNSR